MMGSMGGVGMSNLSVRVKDGREGGTLTRWAELEVT